MSDRGPARSLRLDHARPAGHPARTFVPARRPGSVPQPTAPSITRTLTCLALCLTASAYARTVFTNDRHQGLDRASQTFDRAGDANADSDATRAFVAQCTDVVPFKGDCACLSRTLPAGLSFQQYDAVLGPRSRTATLR